MILKLLLILSLTTIATSENPAIVVRVTEKGLNYVNDFFLGQMVSQIKATKVPDRKESILGYKLYLKNIRIRDMPDTFHSTMQLKPKVGFSWLVKNLTPTITIDYSVAIFWSTYRGTITLKARDLGLKLNFNIKKKGKKAKFQAYNCSPFGSLSLSFDTSILNTLSSALEGRISDELKDVICDNAIKQINTEAEDAIRKLPSHVGFDSMLGKFFFNLSLTDDPIFKDHYVDIPLKGTFSMDSKINKPFTEEPEDIPELPELKNKMFYVLMTSSSINSAFHALYYNNKLRMEKKGEDWPKEYRHFAKTTCSAGTMCMGNFFDQIKTEYKDKMFTGRVVATEPPRFHITDDEATITGKFLGSALIEKNGKTISIMDISGDINNKATIQFHGKKLTFRVDDVYKNIRIKESVIKKMRELSRFKFLISSAADVAEKEAVLYFLNKFGSEGIKYSQFLDENKVKLVQPKIIHGNIDKVMVFGTDINLNSEIFDDLIKENTAATSSRISSRNNLRKALRSQRR